MDLFWWKEKRLRTVWRVEKAGKASFLVGTAHFSPYRFKKALTRLVQNAEMVLFEGPLDEESMAEVVQHGRQGKNSLSVYEALDPSAIKEINRQLGTRLQTRASSGTYLDLIHPKASDLLEEYTQGVRPWMAFFTIWSALLDWKYSMDVEAFQIAKVLGKKIQFLETIEDQLAALDGIPFERIVNYLNHVGNWKRYKELFLKSFMAGELEKFASMTGEFPTRCESILQKRDPVFYRGIKSSYDERETAAFVGVAHVPRIRKLFLDEGYQVIQEEV
jgi:uncharacterized protein YbaP (TraB family)